MITIYHNPRCSKSRECLAIIENSKHKFEIIKYLENRLTFNDFKTLIQKLSVHPLQLIRTKESIWIEKFKDKSLSESEIIQAVVDYPILMERPIVAFKTKAIIARPVEKINELI